MNHNDELVEVQLREAGTNTKGEGKERESSLNK